MTGVDIVRAISAIVIMIAFPLMCTIVIMLFIAVARLRRERIQSMAELERIAAEHVRQLEIRNAQMELLIKDRGYPGMRMTGRN